MLHYCTLYNLLQNRKLLLLLHALIDLEVTRETNIAICRQVLARKMGHQDGGLNLSLPGTVVLVKQLEPIFDGSLVRHCSWHTRKIDDGIELLGEVLHLKRQGLDDISFVRRLLL